MSRAVSEEACKLCLIQEGGSMNRFLYWWATKEIGGGQSCCCPVVGFQGPHKFNKYINLRQVFAVIYLDTIF